MATSIARNTSEARRIESWLHNQIAELGATKIANVAGVNKSTVTRWRHNLVPNAALLLFSLFYLKGQGKGDFEA